MTNDDEYNGWVNRETWTVALHLSYDEGLYRESVRLVAEYEPGTVGAGDALKDVDEIRVGINPRAGARRTSSRSEPALCAPHQSPASAPRPHG